MVDDVNNRSDLLPNITLGLLMLDSCNRDLGGLAQSLKLLPVVNDLDTSTNSSGRDDQSTSKCLGLGTGSICS